MNQIERNISATQALLCALEQDNTLLDDDNFMRQLFLLRKRHEETISFLASRVKEPPRTYHRSVGCEHYVENNCGSFVIEEGDFDDKASVSTVVENIASRTLSGLKTDGESSGSMNLHRKRAQSAGRPRPPVPQQPRQPVHQKSTIAHSGKQREMAKSVGDLTAQKPFVAQQTVPKPFNFVTRKPITNTYSKRFFTSLVEEKKRREEEMEKELKDKKFKAVPVPESTYKTTNTFVTNDRYVMTMRRKVALLAYDKFRKGFQRAKSESEIGRKTAGFIPATTYISPIPVRENLTRRSHSQRAINLLKEAQTPKDLKAHEDLSSLTFNLRHYNCKNPRPTTTFLRRTSPPDFTKIHAKMEEKQQKQTTSKTTVVKPFNLTRPNTVTTRHAGCNEALKKPPKLTRSTTSRDVNVPLNHAALLRGEINRAKIDKEKKVEKKPDAFRDENRNKINAFLGARSRTNEEINKKTQEKLRQQRETAREYRKTLEEINKRVIDGPLVMERQSIWSEQRLAKAAEEKRRSSAMSRSVSVGQYQNQKNRRLTFKDQSPFRRASHASNETYVLSKNSSLSSKASLSEEIKSVGSSKSGISSNRSSVSEEVSSTTSKSSKGSTKSSG